MRYLHSSLSANLSLTKSWFNRFNDLLNVVSASTFYILYTYITIIIFLYSVLLTRASKIPSPLLGRQEKAITENYFIRRGKYPGERRFLFAFYSNFSSGIINKK